jgi:NAD(P)H dehydrogenase (quinone)
MQNNNPSVLLLGSTGQIGNLVTEELAKNSSIELRPAARNKNN